MRTLGHPDPRPSPRTRPMTPPHASRSACAAKLTQFVVAIPSVDSPAEEPRPHVATAQRASASDLELQHAEAGGAAAVQAPPALPAVAAAGANAWAPVAGTRCEARFGASSVPGGLLGL